MSDGGILRGMPTINSFPKNEFLKIWRSARASLFSPRGQKPCGSGSVREKYNALFKLIKYSQVETAARKYINIFKLQLVKICRDVNVAIPCSCRFMYIYISAERQVNVTGKRQRRRRRRCVYIYLYSAQSSPSRRTSCCCSSLNCYKC